jgi:hypothetical protein
MSDVSRYTAEERSLYDVLFDAVLPLYRQAYGRDEPEDETHEQGQARLVAIDKRAEAVCLAVIRNTKGAILPPRARPVEHIIGEAVTAARQAAEMQGGE